MGLDGQVNAKRAPRASIAAIIRTVMPEFGAVGCGFAIADPEVDWMYTGDPGGAGDLDPASLLDPEQLTLAVLPLVGFDTRGHRLGGGRGCARVVV